jgi:FtsZ-binding cell division protein ZapB
VPRKSQIEVEIEKLEAKTAALRAEADSNQQVIDALKRAVASFVRKRQTTKAEPQA